MPSSTEVERTAVEHLPLSYERMTGSRIKVPLPRKGLSDRFCKKLIRTATHTKGIDRAVIETGDDLSIICHMDPEVTRNHSSKLISRLMHRLESKITRSLNESERALRSSSRSGDRSGDVLGLSGKRSKKKVLATA